jgi:tRNA(fMet)-specific endonuclease VapC
LEAFVRTLGLVPYDDETCRTWAKITTIPGRPMSHPDAWIAATAVRHRVPLVTHNRKHFEHIPGLALISEA